MSDCYKLIEKKVNYPEAEMLCSLEDGATLAHPDVFAQSEFLEHLVDFTESPDNPNITNITTVWLKFRRVNTSKDDKYLTELLKGNNNSQKKSK